MTTLPKSVQRRAELVAQIEERKLKVDELNLQNDLACREIIGLDFAIAEAEEEPAIVEPVAKVRAPRRNIAEMVLQFFIRGSIEIATVEAIAREIKCKPGETSAALMRLSKAGNVELVAGSSDRYSLVKEAVSAAAE